AEKLSKTYQNLDQLAKASPEDLQQIEGIGEIMADDIVSWFREWDNQQLLQDFKKAGLWPESLRAEEKTNGSLTGLSFVITGTLPNLTREKAEDLIKEHGGKVVSSVSKKTSYLLLGENPGSKYTKALELGIPILDEDSLKDLLQK
ncbi:MAG: NAD-dependent DNA ligase LigA, partial [Chloroflexi bacterium]|nr:NAD-dependent DNA ligase LigA [Chloroflexota bacterium]